MQEDDLVMAVIWQVDVSSGNRTIRIGNEKTGTRRQGRSTRRFDLYVNRQTAVVRRRRRRQVSNFNLQNASWNYRTF